MSIIDNKKAFHDYFIEERYEAGLVLEGWEVKAIRAGRAQLKEAYVVLKKEEVWLIGCHISPLPTASTHIKPDPTRSRKLLLHAQEIRKLIGKVQQAGFTLVPSQPSLHQGPHQAGDRPGQGQEAPRQAGQRKGKRVGKRTRPG
jgi:SsrA-binding protein